MDPIRYLETTDDLERETMTQIAEEMFNIYEKRDRNLAILIANAVWSGINKRG